MTFRALLLLAAVWLASISPALAQDVALGGKVKEILLGSWVRVDAETERTVEIALQDCSKPIVNEIRRSSDSVRKSLEQVPGWNTANGDLAFFEHDGRLFKAAQTHLGNNADIYEFTRMIVEGPNAFVIGVHTWSHSPMFGYTQTATGQSLETLPIQILLQNGLARTDQFLVQVAQSGGAPVIILTTKVGKDGSRSDASQEYVRCGDIAKLLG